MKKFLWVMLFFVLGWLLCTYAFVLWTGATKTVWVMSAGVLCLLTSWSLADALSKTS